ncbi:hypothetical protein [Pseudogemmobacter bohemicus]|uniref:hypothetical protein n=1 Tax=Pseudogemmobacter bohemicus TaxID=2250708 RepID=UPI000DD3CDC6|nr:hypothetical protein [Pseudogemmobacter bohemicus]
MKPDFALNFTDTSIALLHRTAKGWLKIGETPFDAADLEDALDYMRKTALGLSPGGFTTKLVIPASQILYTEVDISGGDDERTAREISTAIEARTPYRAAEVAWDWQRGEGRTARVAAVARETLAEAESFAATHKFSPVAFVAIPDEADFDGEPWFGEAPDARNYLPDGENVERDATPILLIDEARAARRRAKAARQAEIEATRQAESESEPAIDTQSLPVTANEWPAGDEPADPEPATEALAPYTAPGTVASAAPAEDDQAETALLPPEEAPEIAFAPPPVIEDPAAEAPPPEAPVAAARAPQAELPLEAAPGFDQPAPFGSAAKPVVTATPAPGPRVAITEITPLGNAVAAAPPVVAPAPVAPAVAPVVTAAPAPGPRINLTAGVVHSPAAPASAPAASATTAAVATPDLADADPDEAPFAHVPENTSFPEADEAPDLPPLPHLARRMAGLGPATGQPVAPGPLARAPAPRQQAAQPAAYSASVTDEPDEDLPPAPSAATLAAYGRSGRAAQAGAIAQTTSAARAAPHGSIPPAPPTVPDEEDRPASPLNGGREELAAPPRNGSNGKTARAGSLAGRITAPSIPGTRKTRALPATTGAAPATRSSGPGGTEDAARSLSQSPFAPRKQRGKPRFLGLVLTAILLLCLALVAAWSSFYLSSNRTSGEEETQVAATSATDSAGLDVSTDDEMLADGFDPEAEADGITADAGQDPTADAVTNPAPETTGAEAAPDTALESESPAAVALLDAEDEIFLSSSDAPPPAFDALSLPGPDASAEAPPGAPMPPPPYGTVYRYDENQMLIPTAAGLPTPGGYMLFEGKPPLVPPPRSAVAEAAAEAARLAATPAAAPATLPEAAPGDAATAPVQGEAPVGETPGAAAAAPAIADTGAAGNPSLAGEAVGVTPAVADTAAAATATAEPAVQPNPELADRRPRARPDRALPDDDAALQPATAPVEFASLRPRQRPATVEAASTKARADTAAASLANEAEVQLASATMPALSAEEAANPSIMTISLRPAPRPRDFSRAVEAAVAAAVRAPEPAPAPVETAAAPEPAPKSKSKAATKPEELDEIDEPEVAAGPAPKIPTTANVAKQATYSKAINLGKVNLIGVYGPPSKRYALVRTPNGKYNKVWVGDKIDGGQVKAITQNEVRYQKGGRLIALAMPKG